MIDKLQRRLGEMERKFPSPSLQLPENRQTLKEKLYFGARALTGIISMKGKPLQKESSMKSREQKNK